MTSNDQLIASRQLTPLTFLEDPPSMSTTNSHDTSLPHILPEGTTVVSRSQVHGSDGNPICSRGAVGMIIGCPNDPDHAYRVRFSGGEQVSLKRSAFDVFKHFQRPNEVNDGVTRADLDLYQYVIYRGIVGSRAYGLDHEASDTDRRGFYLPPADLHWSIAGVPEQLERSTDDQVYWELGKFINLALKANPNVLEVMYTPIVEHHTEIADQLLAIRDAFLSKLVYQTYNGYAMSQFKKAEADVRKTGEVKWKHAMHLIRLLLAGIRVMDEKTVPVHVEEHRDRLLEVRRGEVSWDEVDAWRQMLHRRFDEAYNRTTLPDRPDYQTVNAFLISARRAMV